MIAGIDSWHTRDIERLGIPSIKVTDGPHGARTIADNDPQKTLPATCFPTAVSWGATWNPELVQQVGQALGEETREKGCAILLGPCVNIHRSPLGGRNFESFFRRSLLVVPSGCRIYQGCPEPQGRCLGQTFCLE